MKILITGCAGMIGSYLTSDLLRSYPKEKGHKIVGIDNLSRGRIINLKEAVVLIGKILNLLKQI